MSQNVKKYTLLAILAILVAAMGIYLILSYAGISFGNNKQDYPLSLDAPAFELTDVHSNDTVSLAQSDGKVRLIYFYYSFCPDVCPPSTYMLSLVQQALKEEGLFGDKAELFSITFDPDRDTAERLQTFAASFQVDPSGWHFLRDDDAEKVRELARAYKINVIELGNGDLAHQNMYFLVDTEGKIRKYIPATDPDVDQIVRDIKGLL